MSDETSGGDEVELMRELERISEAEAARIAAGKAEDGERLTEAEWTRRSAKHRHKYIYVCDACGHQEPVVRVVPGPDGSLSRGRVLLRRMGTGPRVSQVLGDDDPSPRVADVATVTRS